MSTTWERRAADVRSYAERCAEDLIDISPRNSLLFFKKPRASSVDLTHASPDALARLLGGQRVRLSDLFLDPAELRRVRNPTRNVRDKARIGAEEQGIRPAFLVCGTLSWAPSAATGSLSHRPNAPVLLRSVEITAMNSVASDFYLELGEETEVNQVLLFMFERQYGIRLDPAELRDPALLDSETTGAANDPMAAHRQALEWVDRVVTALRARSGGRLPDLTVTEAFAVGIFSYEKLAMVEDLRRTHELMAGNDVVAALAGDTDAQMTVSSAGIRPQRHLDTIHPRDEFLVRDADSSQTTAINAVLAGGNLVINGPPGTGKSQTIANLIASLAAAGKRTLFVAEKRAAIDAVAERLHHVGLDNLVLDVQGGTSGRGKRDIARQLADALDQASRILPRDHGDLHTRLVANRAILAGHARIIGEPREPWGVSVYDAQARLADLGDDVACDVRLTSDLRGGFTPETRRRVELDLQRLGDLGAFTLRPGSSPWAGARVETDQQARQMYTDLSALLSNDMREADASFRRVVAATGLRAPGTPTGRGEVLDLLDSVSVAYASFAPDAFAVSEEETADLVAGTASRAWRRERGIRMSTGARRALRRRARELRLDRTRRRTVLHEGLVDLSATLTGWREHTDDGRPPHPPPLPELAEARATHRSLMSRLSSVSDLMTLGRLEDMPEALVAPTVRRMLDDPILHNLPEINERLERLRRIGLGALLLVLTDRQADAERAIRMFGWVWLRSFLDETSLIDRAYSMGSSGGSGTRCGRLVSP